MDYQQRLEYGYANRPPLKRTPWARIFFVAFLVAVIIVSVLITVVRNPEFQFTKIHVYGTKTFSKESVEQSIHNYFSENWFGFIPRSSTIFLSKKNLQKRLDQQFPIIEMSYITIPETKTLSVYIQEKKPVALWCAGISACGFIDHVGIMYGPAPLFSKGVYTVFSKKDTDTLPTFGTQVIDPRDMNRFIVLFAELQSDDVKLSRVIFEEESDISFQIEQLFGLYPNDSARLRGTLDQNDSVFQKNLIIGLSHGTFKTQFSKNPKDLEYIDLRFPEKIFYKFKTSKKPLEKSPQETLDTING